MEPWMPRPSSGAARRLLRTQAVVTLGCIAMSAGVLATRLTLLASGAIVNEPACSDESNLWLEAAAELIVIGRIERVQFSDEVVTFEGQLGRIHAFIDLQVEETLKGAIPSRLISVYSPGGTVGSTTELFGDYRLSFYEEGDRVLVYLRYTPDLEAFQVVYHYFKLEDGVVVDGHDLSAFTDGRSIGESELKTKISEYMECNTPRRLAQRSDATVSGVVADSRSVEGGSGTIWRIAVSEVLDGASAPSTISLLIHPWDEVVLHEGERVVVFVKEVSKEYYELVGRLAGKYEVRDGHAVGKTLLYPLSDFLAVLRGKDDQQ